jgi:Pyruvate/2-oxoacid:ferredoxin oxidoreductase delta subunit
MDSQQTVDMYQKLAAKFGFPQSKYLPMIIRKVATPDQAQMMLQLTATNDEIAERLHMDKAKVEVAMQELFEKGVAFPVRKGWRLGRMIDALHDMTLTNLKFWDSYGGNEYGDLWREFEEKEWFPGILEFIKKSETPVGRTTPVMRTIPAWQAVADNPGLIPEEDIRELFKSATTLIAVPCPCRRETYNRECGSPDEMCFSLGRSAEYNLKRGVGRKLTFDEAMEMISRSQKHDAVTQVPNCKITNQIICNCHSCCCVGFRSARQLGVTANSFAASRYVAKVIDAGKCSACQKCVETCQFEAVEIKKYPGVIKWKAFIDAGKCRGCGNCVIKCRKKVVKLELVRPPEYIPEEMTDMYTYDLADKSEK